MNVVTLAMNMWSKIQWDYRQTQDIGSTTDQSQLFGAMALASGEGDGQANGLYRAVLSLTLAHPSIVLDLAAYGSNSIEDCFGRTLSFANIKAILIRNLGVPVNGVYTYPAGFGITVGDASGDTTNWDGPFGAGNYNHTLVIPPSGMFAMSCLNDDMPVGTGPSGSPGYLLKLAVDDTLGSRAQLNLAIAIAGVLN